MVDRFRLSYTLAAVVMLASTAASSLAQPFFGAWSDRRGALWLLPAGVALAGIGIALAAASPAYWLLLLLLVVSGLGGGGPPPPGPKVPALTPGGQTGGGARPLSIGGDHRLPRGARPDTPP